MLFMATCVDKPHSVETRLANRPAHLAYPNGLGTKVKIAGAILADHLRTPLGSTLIFRSDGEADVQAILATEPYKLTGPFENVTVRPWRQAVGQPLA